MAGWSRGTPGKMREKNGAISFATKSMAPAFSPMARMPIHSVMMPASGSAMSITAKRADSKVPSTIRLNTSTSPRKIHCPSAATNATMKKPVQM